MVLHIRMLQNESKLWSFLGFLSYVVGLVCFALSSTFKHLFGDWNFCKFLLYIAISLLTCGLLLFAKKIQVSGSFMVKSHVVILVLMLTSLYSVFYDKSVKGKPDALSTISYAAFAFMSLCFSRKLDLGFEVGFFNFFLGCLTVQLMKISLVLAFVAAVFCYSLIIFRSYLDSQQEIEAAGVEDRVAIRIDSTDGEIFSLQTLPSPSIGEFSWGSISEVTSLSFQHEPTRQGSVLGESISGKNNQQNGEEEKSLSNFSIQDEITDQDNVTSQNNVINGWKQSFSIGTESDSQYPQLRRRRRRFKPKRTSAGVDRVVGAKPPFPQICELCHHPLLPSKDIYMYRDKGFCSLECREQQMIETGSETGLDLTVAPYFASLRTSAIKGVASLRTAAFEDNIVKKKKD